MGAEVGPRLLEGGLHARALGADDVGLDEVAYEQRLVSRDLQLVEGGLEDPAVGLAVADFAGVDADGEEFLEADAGEMAVVCEAGDEGVGNQTELEAGGGHGAQGV